jgi:hypothetical protein
MRIVGFDFRNLNPGFQASFKPDGWTDAIPFIVRRSTAHARSPLLPDDAPKVKALTPVALEWNPGQSLPNLAVSQVINSLVSAAGGAASVPKKATALQVPEILSQRAHVLSYGGMDGVMCAGFMIATFEYKFANPATANWDATKKCFAQDVVVATAYNLAKRRHGNTKTTMVHNKSKKAGENEDQVHTEQLLCGQLGAFLDKLHEERRNCEVVNVYDRWEFKKDVEQKGFDFSKLAVKVKIVFEHVDGNVKTDCAACSATINKLKAKWGPVCRSFEVTVTKGS